MELHGGVAACCKILPFVAFRPMLWFASEGQTGTDHVCRMGGFVTGIGSFPRGGRLPSAETALAAAIVFVGCFLGSSAMKTLRIGGDGPAILFPPYAVLTAALL